MEKRPFVEFGRVDVPGGSIILIQNRPGEVDLFEKQAAVSRHLFQEQRRMEGRPVSLEETMVLMTIQHISANEHRRETKEKGVPGKFVQLFAASKKRDAEKLAAQMVVTRDEFFLLVNNTPQIGFQIRQKFPKFRPEATRPTDGETDAFWQRPPAVGSLSGPALKFHRKIIATFAQRKNVAVHLFENKSAWHCFYFDFSDALVGAGRGQNHWKEGPHVHYTSHLWGYDKEVLWRGFDERNFKPKSEHVRFVDGESE